MKRSKLISILFIVVFALTLSLSVSATGLEETYDLSFTVEASASTVSYNDTFTITVKIDENKGFITAKALVSYDATKVQLVKADVSQSVITKADGSNSTTASDNGDSVTIMMGSAADLFTGTVYEQSGVVAVLQFKVLENVPSDTMLPFAITVNQRDVWKKGIDIANPAYDYVIGTDSVNVFLFDNASHVNSNHTTYVLVIIY